MKTRNIRLFSLTTALLLSATSICSASEVATNATTITGISALPDGSVRVSFADPMPVACTGASQTVLSIKEDAVLDAAITAMLSNFTVKLQYETRHDLQNNTGYCVLNEIVVIKR